MRTGKSPTQRVLSTDKAEASGLSYTESSLPCVLAALVLDVSTSIGPYFAELCSGLVDYYRILKCDDLSAVSVKSALHLVSSGVVTTPYTPVADFVVPEIVLSGGTDLGQGILTCVEGTEAEFRSLAAMGRSLNRVAITIITDGQPTDDTAKGIEALLRIEQQPSVNVFPIAVCDSAFEFLSRVSARTRPARLKKETGSFGHLLKWLAELHATYSRSRPGDLIENPPTDAWRQSR